ncbi:protein CNGC15b-like [Punica granatum]|uniref:Protein CNGC15b-like n=1 Tax=Punica granatum TaxID=22663 RepID=A0A6P8CDN9_PUNGR|nr:protein CNGC15b-like [Punica granatum]XP_031381146.1 protein CNGC15b-like [Punica granatum]XP_031381147.1 protein CNGC15b-like [Punica granatum]
MASDRSKSVRFTDDFEEAEFTQPNKAGRISSFTSKIKGGHHMPEFWPNKADSSAIGKFPRVKELSRVFSEDYDVVDVEILDPRGTLVNSWNKIFLVACLVSLFVDPLIFYLPRASRDFCIHMSIPLEVTLTVIRSVVDAFYVIQIFVRFRTAYVAPSSRVFGRGELILDRSKIASRYIRRNFWPELVASLPLPQVLMWLVIPNLRGSTVVTSKNLVRFIIIFQYLLRLYLLFPLSSQIVNATGVVTQTAWASAAYNLVLFMLASHVLGASWYLLSVERQEECWKKVCDEAKLPFCHYWYLDCSSTGDSSRASWVQSSNISGVCNPDGGSFQFGIYADALTHGVTDSRFFNKYFYCLWWGLRNLSSLGQNLLTSTYVGEIIFAIIIAILGLVLFALLIGNMQTYLQSTTVRLEEWRIRRTDTEQWMKHRQLPYELKQSIRKYDQYRWVTTRGVDEEAILKGLPLDLRREIKRHLCLNLVRQVPLFDQMDDRMLDAICERLKPALCTPGTCVVREGDPVNEMLFIIRGHLDSYTTNGGRTGFFNSCRIGPGDFCGEELLTWALDPRLSAALPSSTRTVEAISEVEAFALVAEDLKFVASQFRKLHSKQLRYTFRFYSHQWRTWAACFIQAAWFRYRRHKEAAELKKRESFTASALEPMTAENTKAMLPRTGSGFVQYASRLATSTRRGGSQRCRVDLNIISSLQKPTDPDFSVEDR